jgi:hypothetical protein
MHDGKPIIDHFFADDATPAEVLRHYEEKIAELGYTVVYVTGDGESLPYGYTIGMTGMGRAEFITSGMLSPETMYRILSVACQVVIATGKEIPLGVDSEIYTFRMAFQQLDHCTVDQYMQEVGKVYPGKLIKVVNILWADPENKLPYEAGFNEQYHRQILFKSQVN